MKQDTELYRLKVEFYNAPEIKFSLELPWKSAIKSARLLSEQLFANSTRHNSMSGLIQHLDSYWDLYNEGHVVVEKINP